VENQAGQSPPQLKSFTVSKSMLIIKSNAGAIKDVELFLKNRDWFITSTDRLKDAIAFLIQNKPSFVLISVDHPNKKVRMLPKILSQSFPCCVIVFGEKLSATTFKKIIDSQCEYKVNPPPTGPAVERAVNKFIRDRELQSKATNAGNASSSTTSLAGNQKGKSDFEFQIEIKSQKPTGSGILNFQKDVTSIEGQANQDSHRSGDPERPNPESYDQEALKSPDSHDEEDESTNRPQKQSAKLNKQNAGSTTEKKGTPSTSARTPIQKKNQDTFVVGKSTPQAEQDYVFIKGVNQALDESVVKVDGTISEELEDSSHLACIIVESNRFSGYLVAALGKDKKMDGDFVDLIRSRLSQFLKANGEPLDDENSLQLKIKRVNFEGWALEYAQFLRKSVHKGDEVAMAFFPFANVKTELGESAQENMASVSTEEIQTDVPLEFNMYIYMPTNKKYILYTPQGGTFLTEQKERLNRQGVTKMHIQKQDVQNLSKFKAQNHLNTLVTEYEKSEPEQKKKKAG
jgi:hypothetical protein